MVIEMVSRSGWINITLLKRFSSCDFQDLGIWLIIGTWASVWAQKFSYPSNYWIIYLRLYTYSYTAYLCDAMAGPLYWEQWLIPLRVAAEAEPLVCLY